VALSSRSPTGQLGSGHHGAVSTSWSSPDPRQQVVTGTAFGVPFERVEPVAPPRRDDIKAALLALVASVLAGAPVGLLWSQLAPRAQGQLSGEDVLLVETYTGSFIAADGYFVGAALVAGAVGGLLAWRLGSRHGPAVVVTLALGGVLAGLLAMVTGEQIGLSAAREAVSAGSAAAFELPLELKAREALVVWPLASLVAYLAASLVKGR
jgi:hypothetical protein